MIVTINLNIYTFNKHIIVARKLDSAGIIKYDELIYLINTAVNVERAHIHLAWSFCFRYFMGEGLHMDLFEAIQGMAEYYIDMLHECVESANVLLRRPIATDHMVGAFRGHKRKVDIGKKYCLYTCNTHYVHHVITSSA